ncbi:MAG: iron-sulfur cluster assembly scaffold protein [Candidatus Eremiobacteraeota bacterium]|nr:iron-sulfur cluster assembly scaffold protein [Candidatus Eremiobacteraeota bacterium]
MNFEKFQRLVEDRTGFRTMENPTASGEYLSDSCGDMYNFFLKVGPGAIIEDISYFTTGCGFGTATCSLVVDLAKGKTISEAAQITEQQVVDALDGYPEKKRDYPQRALEALHVALDDYTQKVSAGAVPDFAAMPVPERPTVDESRKPAAAAPVTEDGKLLIRLH